MLKRNLQLLEPVANVESKKNVYHSISVIAVSDTLNHIMNGSCASWAIKIITCLCAQPRRDMTRALAGK